MASDELTLMLRVREDDRQAFDRLVEMYRDHAVNMLFRMVGNRDDAEELAQEAFLRIYRARKRWRPEASFTTWFHRIATNLAINHRRKKSPARLPEYEEGTDPVTPDDGASRAELVKHVWTAVQELPARQRAALVLTRLEGCTYVQAAEAMDVSVDAIRSLVARARDELRDRLRSGLGADSAME